MRRFADLLLLPTVLACLTSTLVYSADPQPSLSEIDSNIRSVCKSAPKVAAEFGFQEAKSRVSALLLEAESHPAQYDLVPLIYITLSELSLGQGKMKQSFRQLIYAASKIQPLSDKDFQIRIIEQGIIINTFAGKPYSVIWLLEKWERIGYNGKDLWREKFLYHTAIAAYFTKDKETHQECLDIFASKADGEVLAPTVRNFWLLEAMLNCLEGRVDTAEEYILALDHLSTAHGNGGLSYFVHALLAQARGEPDMVVADILNDSKLAYMEAGRPGFFPLMLTMILRYRFSTDLREDWIAFHEAMAEFATPDQDPFISAFAHFSKALPQVDSSESKEELLRISQENLLFSEILLDRLQLSFNRVLEEHLADGNFSEKSESSFYATILFLLLIVLLLVMILRIRTQWLINQRLRESVEKSRIAEKAADHASRLKSEFVSNISHEIKTPMGGLVGMTSILDELIQDPVQRKYLGTIRECSKNLMVLIDDLLDLGRIEAGRLEIDQVPFSLAATIEYCTQMVSQSAYQKGLEFKIETSDSLPDIFIGDPTRIGQVLINLLNNAIKFTNVGSVLLKIEYRQTIGRVGKIIASVQDTGVGISPEYLRTVFEPFNQTNRPPGKAVEGSGLGLAISKQLVDLMGGTLMVKSEANVGSVFTMELSLRQADEETYPDD